VVTACNQIVYKTVVHPLDCRTCSVTRDPQNRPAKKQVNKQKGVAMSKNKIRFQLGFAIIAVLTAQSASARALFTSNCTIPYSPYSSRLECDGSSWKGREGYGCAYEAGYNDCKEAGYRVCVAIAENYRFGISSEYPNYPYCKVKVVVEGFH